MHDQMKLAAITQKSGLLKVSILHLFKKKNIQWIAVNDTIKNQLLSHGVNKDNVQVIPAYIKNDSTQVLSDELIYFINNHSPVISLYAVGTSTYNGHDLYGIDLALDLTKRLSEEYPQIGLIVCIPGEKNTEIMNKYYKFIKNNELETNVFFQFEGLINMNQIWKESQIYLRPTNTDGDALAVREALDCKSIVVASDVVQRPDGCILFKNRDSNDLFYQVKNVLHNIEYHKNQIPKQRDFFDEIIKIYLKLMN